MTGYNEFKHIKYFSKELGINEERLIQAYEIEKEFHNKILQEQNKAERKLMYKTVYEKVHPLYKMKVQKSSKKRLVNFLKEELEGKSILDVGCGDGSFLKETANLCKYKKLVGIDISTAVLPKDVNNIEFINGDIIDFNVSEKFDVIFSHNVLEHIAPMDLSDHFHSIKDALKENGKFILIMPNRLFGPTDITRIIDNTLTCRLEARGTHLNESTYTEIITLLKKFGFVSFYIPIAMSQIIPILPNIKLNPNYIIFLENNDKLLQLMYKITFKSKCICKLPIILICKLKREGD